MLLTFLSTTESCELSARIASSPGIAGPDVTVPSMRPPTAPPAGLPAVPTVVEPIGAPPAVDVDPEELAVPAEFVPGVVGFNTAEGWSQDVSADVAHEIRHRCDLQLRDVPFFLQGFVDRYEGRYQDVQLPLPMRLV
jgi:hypothetical protein